MRTKALLTVLLFCAADMVLGAPTERWRIDGLSLVVNSERESTLTLKASSTQVQRLVNLTTKVRLTKIEASRLVGDRLAVMDAATVVIFDLTKGREADWFFCALPRILDDRIVYVEWSPSHLFSYTPRAVVLVYDLTKSPVDNRLPSSRDQPIPAPITGAPIEVGIPVYPEWNVRNASYRNVVENPDEEESIFPSSVVSLGNDRLAFVAHRGRDALSSQNFIVSVDLARGLRAPVLKTYDIPTNEFKRLGQNPRAVLVNRMEAIGNDAVRLFVPESDYGIDSILVKLPD